MLVSIVSLTFGPVDNAESSPTVTGVGCCTKERQEPSPTQEQKGVAQLGGLE